MLFELHGQTKKLVNRVGEILKNSRISLVGMEDIVESIGLSPYLISTELTHCFYNHVMTLIYPISHIRSLQWIETTLGLYDNTVILRLTATLANTRCDV